MKYVVAKLPLKEGYRVEYMCRGVNWSTHIGHAAHMNWMEATATRDRLRKELGLSRDGVASIVVIDVP